MLRLLIFKPLKDDTQPMIKKRALISLIILMTITACAQFEVGPKTGAANRIARPAFMVERLIPTENFKLYVWERMHDRGAPGVIYIGADSLNWPDKDLVADDFLLDKTTPENPMTLHLATRDSSSNVAYLSRPCQYLNNKEAELCPEKYRNDARYSSEVIDSYHTVLDEMKARYDLSSFHLVGVDGGAQIAAFLTAERKDVVSLRTISGNLNHSFVATEHGSTPLNDSLNAVNIAPRLAHVPQHHFIGGADSIITPGVYHSFRQAMGNSSCVHYSLVQDAGHHRGWVEKWPELMKILPECTFKESGIMPEPAKSNFEPYIPSRDYRPISKPAGKTYSK